MQLSFAAVISLFRIYPALRRVFRSNSSDNRWRRLLDKPLDLGLVSLAATIGTMPLIARHFHWVSLSGLVTNIVATPLASCVVVPSALLGSFLAQVSDTIGGVFLVGAEVSGNYLMNLAKWSSDLSLSGFYVPQPSVTECLLFYFCSIGFSVPNLRRGRRLVWLALAALVCLFSYHQLKRYFSEEMVVSFLPVGNGDAIVLEMPNGKTALIDTGPSYRASSAAERIIGPYLRHRRITKLDAIFLTHSDNDHAGGLATILAQFPVETLYWNGNFTNGDRKVLKELQKHAEARSLSAGDWIGVGRTRFEILHPPAKSNRAVNSWSRNDQSLVMRLEHSGHRFLFTGDIEESAERYLWETAPEKLKAHVLKVAHHGSRTSSKDAFLKLVGAGHAVISVGANNRFGMPHPEALGRLQNSNLKIWRTDHHGLIQFRLSGKTLEVVPFRF